MKKIILISIITVITFLAISFSVQAQGSIINPADPKYAEGTYELNDFILLAINVSNLILRFVGSLALLMFIYGGFTFLLSAGSSDKVTKGKNILVAAIIGLIIVFTSFLIIKFALLAVGITWNGQILPPK